MSFTDRLPDGQTDGVLAVTTVKLTTFGISHKMKCCKMRKYMDRRSEINYLENGLSVSDDVFSDVVCRKADFFRRNASKPFPVCVIGFGHVRSFETKRAP